MIEPFLRGQMSKVAFRLQVHPRLERFRARLPYFVVAGMITVLLMLPAVGLLGLAQLLGYRGTPEMTLTRSWGTMAALPPGIMAVFVVISGIAWLSGYRPFRRRWEDLPLRQAVKLSQALQQAAEAQGFSIVWRSRGGGSFVAVRDIAMERSLAFNDGHRFPMRLSLLLRRDRNGRADAALKLANRTCVIWDTGEGDTCRRAGEAIIAAVDIGEPARPG